MMSSEFLGYRQTSLRKLCQSQRVVTVSSSTIRNSSRTSGSRRLSTLPAQTRSKSKRGSITDQKGCKNSLLVGGRCTPMVATMEGLPLQESFGSCCPRRYRSNERFIDSDSGKNVRCRFAGPRAQASRRHDSHHAIARSLAMTGWWARVLRLTFLTAFLGAFPITGRPLEDPRLLIDVMLPVDGVLSHPHHRRDFAPFTL